MHSGGIGECAYNRVARFVTGNYTFDEELSMPGILELLVWNL